MPNMLGKILLVGKYKIQMRPTDDNTFVPICANCGQPLGIHEIKEFIAAAETGYVYCSMECAISDVKEAYEEQGDEG